MVLITREYDKDGVADGTVEGEEEDFSPDAGLEWTVKFIKWAVSAGDEDCYMLVTYRGEVLMTLNTAHIPSNPDLVPANFTVGADEKVTIATTNQSGAAKDVWAQLFIEETST